MSMEVMKLFRVSFSSFKRMRLIADLVGPALASWDIGFRVSVHPFDRPSVLPSVHTWVDPGETLDLYFTLFVLSKA